MSCAACGVRFDDDSDIVICPECGAPHHRECWQQEGHCACEERHSETYEWEPERTVLGGFRQNHSGNDSSKALTQTEDSTVVCPRCGSQTSTSRKYCERCGYYLEEAHEDSFFEDDKMSEFAHLFDFDESESIEGVPAGDMKRFVGGMWIYYIPRFIRMVHNKTTVSFNFTAFLAHGLWFISRKMYLPGILLMIMVTGISSYQIYFSSVVESLTGAKLLLGYTVYLCLSCVEGLTMLLCGLFGNNIYMKFCAGKIKKINLAATKENVDAATFNKRIEAEGGVAMVEVLSVGLCYLGILLILERGFLF